MNEEEKQAWKEQHKEKCLVNYDKEKSSSMEDEITEILFARSTERGFRYTTILSDEDSSTFNRLKNLNPYGDSFWKETGYKIILPNRNVNIPEIIGKIKEIIEWKDTHPYCQIIITVPYVPHFGRFNTSRL
ncbi:UNVERIFIED_CONTAM: hypothetical protein RMT77_011496 [Armadillidium vulgare]